MANKPPKLKQLPKKPKAGASSSTMDRYLEKVALIQKENKEKMDAYNSEKAKREKLIVKVRAVKASDKLPTKRATPKKRAVSGVGKKKAKKRPAKKAAKKTARRRR